MRMCIQIGRCPMRCPSRMSDSYGTRKCRSIFVSFPQAPSDGPLLSASEFLFSIVYSNSGRIVSAVLQLLTIRPAAPGQPGRFQLYPTISTHRFFPPNSKRRHPCSVFRLCRLLISCSLLFYHAAPFSVNLMEHFVFTYKIFLFLIFYFHLSSISFFSYLSVIFPPRFV